MHPCLLWRRWVKVFPLHWLGFGLWIIVMDPGFILCNQSFENVWFIFLAHLQVHPRALDSFLFLESCVQPGKPPGRHLSHIQMAMNESLHRPNTNLDLMDYLANSYALISQNGSLNFTNRCLIKGRRGRSDLGAVSTEFRPCLNSQCQRFLRSHDEAS